MGGDALLSDSSSVADASRHQRSAERDPLSVAPTVLTDAKRVLVIDDFHHVAPAVQRTVIRQLKPLIEGGAGVVLVAVPHRAADVVVAEGEMDGRVERLRIGLWHEAELMGIANKGFAALAVEPEAGLSPRLASLSYRSPHLMQLLCREVCKASGVRSTASPPQTLVEPTDWDEFLSVVAVRYTHDETYRSLVRGPQTRKDRIERRMRLSNQMTDIYGAVMAALRAVAPVEEIEYNALRDALRRLLKDLPPKEQVTNTLRHMSDIADELARDEHGRLRRDPLLEWRHDRDTLYVTDPFFAFRLRFGPPVLRGRSTEGPPRVGEERRPTIENRGLDEDDGLHPL